MTDQNLPAETDDAATPAMIRADLVMSMVLIVLALAVFYGSWTMDRLEVRRIQPFTIPGLVPGLLSIALFICGLVLAMRSWRAPAVGGWADLGAALTSAPARRAGAVLVLVLIYTLVLVGLAPFWLATGLFVFAFILVFETWLAEPRQTMRKSLPWALGLAIVTATVVTLVFERLFLVRLP